MVPPTAWSWRADWYDTSSWFLGRIVIGAHSNEFNAEPLFHSSRTPTNSSSARWTIVACDGQFEVDEMFARYHIVFLWPRYKYMQCRSFLYLAFCATTKNCLMLSTNAYAERESRRDFHMRRNLRAKRERTPLNTSTFCLCHKGKRTFIWHHRPLGKTCQRPQP